MPAFTDAGSSEATKGAVHGAVAALVMLCGAYNALAWIRRRQPHLALNVLVYGALLAFEVYQVKRHGEHAVGEDEDCGRFI